ncbi:zinc ribbon domain-containing protein [Pantoea sp. BAV 3049]|uniref:zinc ribbon domain-containing protein n=1 Tax=Pantoea sp. BAV 3049 TaxID=2654188 RepID=UPI00131B1DE0|nr:zinc ribbon domain-containing protein [Pantoea sp. BAV 3049]
MSLPCPVCQHSLTVEEGHYHCESCERCFAMQAICPECHQTLQVLKACGAVDYFCTNGHGLISKKRVEFTPLVESL